LRKQQAVLILSVVSGQTERESKLKIRICGIWTALMIATAAVAQEDTESANFMLPYCKLTPAQATANQATGNQTGGNKAGSSAFLAGRCAGLVQGIADTLALMKEANSDKLTPLCVDRPKGANTDQAVKVVVKYGDAHPDQIHAPFSVVAALALTEAWPCRK
jgi:hypothetical protein